MVREHCISLIFRWIQVVLNFCAKAQRKGINVAISRTLLGHEEHLDKCATARAGCSLSVAWLRITRKVDSSFSTRQKFLEWCAQHSAAEFWPSLSYEDQLQRERTAQETAATGNGVCCHLAPGKGTTGDCKPIASCITSRI